MFERLRVWGKNGIYALLSLLCWVIVKLLFRLRTRGRRNVQRHGEYIAVARHRSYWDAILLAVALGPFRRVHFISRTGLMKGNPLIQPILRAFSTSIAREGFRRQDFRNMLQVIKKERLIGLFPEGTTKAVVDAKAGAVHFAKLTGKEFLPVNIAARGPYPPKYPFRYPRLTVSIGRPFGVSDLEDGDGNKLSRAARYRRMSERLMARVDNA